MFLVVNLVVPPCIDDWYLLDRHRELGRGRMGAWVIFRNAVGLFKGHPSWPTSAVIQHAGRLEASNAVR